MVRARGWAAVGTVALTVASLVGSTGATAAPSPSPDAGVPASTTPELLADAVAGGDLDQATADRYLAHALGDHTKLPARFRSAAAWEGTVPLLRLQERVARMPKGAARLAVEQALAPAASTASCSSSSTPLANHSKSPHFYVTYDAIGGGIGIDDYLDSLETSWATEVTTFGWAAPPVKLERPAPGNRYHVRVEDLGSGLYGFVAGKGTHAGFVGDNPNTPWDDVDAKASCMVLNEDYTAFPGTPRQALDATTAHEFNHSIQFGYGALSGPNVPDDSFVEGGATWMEDEVMDAADDNQSYLWPKFTDSLGEYNASPYPYWITFRGITERFGTGPGGDGEQVFQDFWELISQDSEAQNVGAFATALATTGVTLSDAFHDYAIAAKFLKPCGGGYALPHCFEEAADYEAAAGPNAAHAKITPDKRRVDRDLEDDYSMLWVALPGGTSSYDITLRNTDAGGTLRGSVVCDTGTTLAVSPLPSTVGGGATTTLVDFDPTGCTSVVAVVTNQTQSPGNPDNPVKRTFKLSITRP